MSISSAGSQDTCDLCPNSADSLKYIGSFDDYIIAYPQAFVNTKMQNKKALLKTTGLKRLFRRLEAKIPKIPVTYVRTQQTNCDISGLSTAILYHITAYLSTLYHLKKIKFQIIRFRHIEKYRVVRGLLSCFNKLELNACVLCSTHYHFHKQPVLHKMRT